MREYQTDEGVWVRVYREYYSNGTLNVESSYVGKKLCGMVRKWHRNGVLRATIHYVEGTRNGEVRRYWDTGAPMLVGAYTDGKKAGRWIHFHKDPARGVRMENMYA